MPESKIIPFDTKYKALDKTGDIYNLIIDLQPESMTPNTLEGCLNLNLIDNFINNKKSTPASLSVIMKNHLNDIDFHIDRNGDLIVNSEDCENYSLDENGHLIYTNR